MSNLHIFCPEHLKLLEAELAISPMPSMETLRSLANTTGAKISEVNKWFDHRRRFLRTSRTLQEPDSSSDLLILNSPEAKRAKRPASRDFGTSGPFPGTWSEALRTSKTSIAPRIIQIYKDLETKELFGPRSPCAKYQLQAAFGATSTTRTISEAMGQFKCSSGAETHTTGSLVYAEQSQQTTAKLAQTKEFEDLAKAIFSAVSAKADRAIKEATEVTSTASGETEAPEDPAPQKDVPELLSTYYNTMESLVGQLGLSGSMAALDAYRATRAARVSGTNEIVSGASATSGNQSETLKTDHNSQLKEALTLGMNAEVARLTAQLKAVVERLAASSGVAGSNTAPNKQLEVRQDPQTLGINAKATEASGASTGGSTEALKAPELDSAASGCLGSSSDATGRNTTSQGPQILGTNVEGLKAPGLLPADLGINSGPQIGSSSGFAGHNTAFQNQNQLNVLQETQTLGANVECLEAPELSSASLKLNSQAQFGANHNLGAHSGKLGASGVSPGVQVLGSDSGALGTSTAGIEALGHIPRLIGTNTTASGPGLVTSGVSSGVQLLGSNSRALGTSTEGTGTFGLNPGIISINSTVSGQGLKATGVPLGTQLLGSNSGALGTSPGGIGTFELNPGLIGSDSTVSGSIGLISNVPALNSGSSGHLETSVVSPGGQLGAPSEGIGAFGLVSGPFGSLGTLSNVPALNTGSSESFALSSEAISEAHRALDASSGIFEAFGINSGALLHSLVIPGGQSGGLGGFGLNSTGITFNAPGGIGVNPEDPNAKN